MLPRLDRLSLRRAPRPTDAPKRKSTLDAAMDGNVMQRSRTNGGGGGAPNPGDACTDDDVFFTAVNVRAPPNAPGTADEWYRRARQALTGPKSDAHRYFTFTLNRTSGPSPEATFKWSWHEPTARADPMPALVHDAQKGTKRIGVAKMRAQPFTRSDRQMFGKFLLIITPYGQLV